MARDVPVKRIESRDNPLLVQLRKRVGDPAAYRKYASIWLEGEHLCSAYAARGERAPQAVISESAWNDATLRELSCQAAAVAVVADPLIAALSSLESPAPIGYLVPWSGATALQATAPSVVLDRLQDAGNVGTILRSAAAFGFTQVIALKGTAALGSPKVLRAGMGAHFGLRLIEQADEQTLADLQVPLIATSSHANDPIDRAPLPWPCAWVFGHEGQGVSPALLQRCALRLRIPQPGGEESLNVSAAAAVCLYESARQRSR